MGKERAAPDRQGSLARAESRAPKGPPPSASQPESLLTDMDLHLFNEGTHYRLYEKLGAHARPGGTHFAVWAPSADYVAVIGDFNGWDPGKHPLRSRGNSGIWEGFIPGVGEGTIYKYHIAAPHNGHRVNKADPFGFYHEVPPRTGSIVHELSYAWGDQEWMRTRGQRNSLKAPMSIYEVHLGSWMRTWEPDRRPLSYRELAPRLADHVQGLGFTHVELMPITEHPFSGSWGYQATGYFAPTSRFGTPQDFMYLVDHLHKRGIGVILDWVPSHFPNDEHGLAFFDGTHLFEHSDPRQGFHPDWKSAIFNYGRNEVRAFLISSAYLWLDKYHIDGLRVDAVASMLYLDYSRKEGEWIPNQYGGNENIEAIGFLRQFNAAVYGGFPDVQTTAEESTAWPSVSRPTYVGGLGFGFKWDMGWMHDTLKFVEHDPVHRKFHHGQITFRGIYMFSENYVLPLSHDEVVHGKGALLSKMPGDLWQRFANMRLLLSYQWAQPGKKLLFMGGEFGQWREWNHEEQLDWELLNEPMHKGLASLVERLNRLYREEPALHQLDCNPAGFAWLDASDHEHSTLSFLRKSEGDHPPVACVFNFTPVPRYNYRIGAPVGGRWVELCNTDAQEYGGSGQGNLGGVDAAPVWYHGHQWSLTLTLPPLGAVFLRPAGG
jgi:1,4-alpha-glucan branching enzyme